MNMHPLLTLSASEKSPTDYVERVTVKGVVLNERGEVALFGGLLLGGGVEPGEELPPALARECMEEGGIEISDPSPIGVVEQYRDTLRKKYIVHGFLAHARAVHLPTTTLPEEQNKMLAWIPLEQAAELLRKYIARTEQEGPSALPGDEYQSRLYNAKTSLCFVERAIELTPGIH